jgi:hypothetical protein
MKHLACALLHLEFEGTPTAVSALLGRARVLESESLLGYPAHRFLAAGCVALAAEALQRTQTAIAQELKKQQRCLEKGQEWLDIEVPADSLWTGSRMLALGHLHEAVAEAPDDHVAALLRNHRVWLQNKSGIQPYLSLYEHLEKVYTSMESTSTQPADKTAEPPGYSKGNGTGNKQNK